MVTCQVCLFWDEISGTTSGGERMPGGIAGVCRYNPPMHVQELAPESVPRTLISGMRPAIWPITRAADWCGAGKLKEPTT